ncbi:MAG: YtxH domain-containing protein [Candidatus Sericytochromatia bacterium]|nr:YtxH domain-containing protein [Candidatus Sericytochromatia bacterium]
MGHEQELRGGRSGSWDLVGGLMVGAVGGFMLGVLLAPRQGDAARDRIDESLEDFRDRAEDFIGNLRGNTENLLNQTRTAIEERITLITEAIEEGRKAADDKRAELVVEQEGS